MSNFTHLHVHTHYSLLDGLGKIDKLLEKAKILGMDSLAITDHGNMYGAIEFYNKAKEIGIKPILGAELYISPRKMTDKTVKIDTSPFHLTVLAKNKEGYLNLIYLVTQANLVGYYYKPRVDKELLRSHSKGLVALSGCLNGELSRLVINKNFKEAKKKAEEYQEIFGKGNFYLEIQSHKNIPEQLIVNKELIKLSKETGIPLVASSDVHYVDYEDREAQDILICVQTNKTVQDKDRMSMLIDDFSLKPESKMIEFFKDTPEAIKNTKKIADMCNLELKFESSILPHFQLPEGFTDKTYLEKLVKEGIKFRYGDNPSKEILDRIDYELDVIEKTGFISYFLIVGDIVNWAKKAGIGVGPGRGSAAGSIVAYLMNITNIDPIKHILLFERFLNPERISMPDIDLDFADDRRSEVIKYIVQRFGHDKVAQIITFGTMAARNAVRDCGRALGLAYTYVDRIAKMIPANMNLEKTLKNVPELREEYEKDPQIKKLIDLAKKLEGVVRHASTHAAGIVIGDKPLINYLPLQNATSGNEDIPLTQYSMYELEKMGLLKIDILGLKNLTILQNALRIIEKTQNTKIDLEKLELDDMLTFLLLSKAETVGVFQFESSGMQRYLKELKPTNFEDITSMVALYRPGPMDSIPDFINGKHGRKEITYLHPSLKPILENTYGVVVTQEQVLQIAREFAGFTYGEADILRKAVGKKIHKLLLEQRKKFIDGAVKEGHKKDIAIKVWDFIEPFASYGFNKSHAACYALIAYWTAYLKAHYPSEYMAALLSSDEDNIDRISIEFSECEKMGLKVLAPDVNESFEKFTVLPDGNLRFGLGAVKNVGKGAIEVIVDARKKGGEFEDLQDFCKRVDFSQINKKVIESLIKSGAMDKFGERAQMLLGLENILKYANNLHKRGAGGQIALFESGNNNYSEDLVLEPVEPVTNRQKLSWEKELLGVYISGHPLADFAEYLDKATTPIKFLENKHDGKETKVGGIITKVHKITTRKGEPMAFVMIEDKSQSIELIVFPNLFSQNSQIWHEDNVIEVSGKVNLKDGQLKILVDKVSEVGEQMMMETDNSKQITDNRKLVEGEKKNSNSQKILHLKIPKKGTKELLLDLKNIFLKFPGENSVILLLPQDGHFKELKINNKVELSESLMDELKNLLSEDEIEIK
jgi:DNA polymerase-3 subunit alpha